MNETLEHARIPREFLLSQPYDTGSTRTRISPAEVCEALSTPLRFLAVLLSRHPTFVKEIPARQSWTGPISPLDLVTSADLVKLETG
jgi:hypothetical protein